MRISLGISLVAVVCISSFSWAQERTPPAVRREASAVKQAAWSADQQIAALLFLCNRNEVEISTFAQDRLTNEDVREFAATMVKDHTPGMEKWQQIAGPLASAQVPGTPSAGVRGEEIGEDIKVEARPAAGQGFDWNTVHKQLADQCLASTKAEFAKKQGAELDQCYMGLQVMSHMKALDELKVLRNFASAELRKDIDETTKTVTRHLDDAKKIAESLKESGERVSRKPKAE